MSNNLSGYTLIEAQGIYEGNTVQQHALGQMGMTTDGRKFRYVKAGELLVTGDLYQNSAVSTDFVSMAVPSAAAIGSSEVAVTLGGTAVTANQFDEGYLVVSASTGIGQQFQIESHTVQTSTTGTCTFTIAGTLAVALVAAASTVTVVRNPYVDVVKQPTTPTGNAVGVAQFAIASGSFGWIQSGGIAACLSDSNTTSADAKGLSPSTTTAGTMALALTTDARIGNTVQLTTVSAAVAHIQLTID